MKELMLLDRIVKIDDDDFVCLTDLYKASGCNEKNKPALYLKNDRTKQFIQCLDLKVGFPTLRTQRGGRAPGTWAHKYVAYDYASWIDPHFKVSIFIVLDAYFNGGIKTGRQHQMQSELQEHVLEIRISEQLGSFHGKGLYNRKREKRQLNDKSALLLEKYQGELGFDQPALLEH